ncbi:ATP-binding protein [Flavobacterium ginsenosidimutans]|uniref:histidine kinase n=1 Tax=Flavobacterium ginsenosidimutans TaxID=687844 RepID=A0ABZ2Q942_9FLAO
MLISLFSCKEKKRIDPNIESIKKEALSLRDTADINFEKQNLNTAFYQFNKSKELFEIVKDSPNISYVLIRMSDIQQINGDYYGSKETVTEAIPYAKTFENHISSINNSLGIADKELSLYDDAIFYYKESIKGSKNLEDSHSPLSNIAVVYMQQKKYNAAITLLEFLLSQKFIEKKSNASSKARIQDNLGYAYFKNGMHQKGFDLMNQGLLLKNEIKDNYSSIESYLHLADYYSKRDVQKSDENALAAYTIATKLNSVEERLEALQILISNDNTPNTNKYIQHYFTLNDSLIKVRNNFKNKSAKIKYDAKKEKDENEKLRLEKTENLLSLQRAKYMRIVFVIVFVFLMILIVLLIRYYKNKNKAIEFKSSYDTETRIAKKIHDELANDVFQVIAFAESLPLPKENTKENLLQKLDDIYGRVREISKENNKVEIGTGFIKSIKEMLSAYNTNERNIITTNLESVNWETIDNIKKITIGRVLQELMVNMKKHSKAYLVVIKFESDKKSIFINYTDNGIGCEKTAISKNGLRNMESHIETVKGTIEFETEPDKGFKAKIVIPR